MSEPVYKLLDLNDTHRDWIQSLVMNGYTFTEIAEALGLSKTGFQKSLANKTEIQHILKQGSEKAVSDVTLSLQKLAKGFIRTEKEYNVDIDRQKLLQSAVSMIEALKSRDIDKFLGLFTSCSSGEAIGKIKVKEIEVAPDKNAAIRILEVLKEDTWDLDAKHKRIPNVKIVVGLEGGNKRGKEIPADFVLTDKKG